MKAKASGLKGVGMIKMETLHNLHHDLYERMRPWGLNEDRRVEVIHRFRETETYANLRELASQISHFVTGLALVGDSDQTCLFGGSRLRSALQDEERISDLISRMHEIYSHGEKNE